MSEQAPQQSPLTTPQHCTTEQRHLAAAIAPWIFASLKTLRSSTPMTVAALVLGLGLPTAILVSLLHPQSPFKTTLNVKTGGADIAETDPDFPQPQLPQKIQFTNDPQSQNSELHEQPTVNTPLQGFCHPLWGKGWLSQGIRGVTHNGRMEYAYDYAAGIGTPVYAMRAGRVISIQDKYPDWGGNKEQIHRFNHVWLEHEKEYRSAYVHLQQGFRQRVNLKVGDEVKAGQIIGYSGNSGWSSGPHLHVEVHRAEERFRFTQTVPFAVASSCNLGRQVTALP